MPSTLLAPAALDYPSTDGKPLAEGDFQATPLIYAREALRDHFRHRDDVYVAANLLIYYQEGTRASVAPDVFVVIGAPNRDRMSYRLWDEPKGPDFVLEVTSRSTRPEDQGPKRELYRELRVAEYWRYDPTGDYLRPQLQGERLSGGEYRALPMAELEEGTLALTSGVLGLELRVTERGLRFRDPATGEDLLSHAEHRAGRERERQARQRAEQDRQRERQGRQRAEQDQQRAEQGWQRAEQGRKRERQARQVAEARLAKLEALLRRQRGSE